MSYLGVFKYNSPNFDMIKYLYSPDYLQTYTFNKKNFTRKNIIKKKSLDGRENDTELLAQEAKLWKLHFSKQSFKFYRLPEEIKEYLE